MYNTVDSVAHECGCLAALFGYEELEILQHTRLDY